MMSNGCASLEFIATIPNHDDVFFCIVVHIIQATLLARSLVVPTLSPPPPITLTPTTTGREKGFRNGDSNEVFGEGRCTWQVSLLGSVRVVEAIDP
ncbi:UNVERIFIED_CONTAM: hypothetical protein PYX00_008528 [Menopon gallinae]|uniref:Uncharacterized protein n=1 Tax=Menopon gallinae TaxID=328185 RepID=A0AAW2HP29_9NEOP